MYTEENQFMPLRVSSKITLQGRDSHSPSVDQEISVKSKSKAVALPPCSAKRERKYSSYSFLTSALDGVRGQRHTPAAPYPQGKGTRYPLDRRLCGPELVWTQRLEETSFTTARDHPASQRSQKPVTDDIISQLDTTSRYLPSCSMLLSAPQRKPPEVTRVHNYPKCL
jgi:hypothetical protein